MATFNKSNWTRTASSEHARVYAPSAITTGNVTGNGGVTTVTVTVPWQFQGPGQCEVSVPTTATALNSGLSIGTVQLLGPSGTSYATPGGSTSHPRIQFPIVNSTNGNLNIQTGQGDVIIVQY